MALSQCLDDSLFRAKSTLPGAGSSNLQEVYNEKHRLALEELLSGGVDDFLGFLRKESIANFLSDEEIRWMRGAAVAPRHASLLGEHRAPPPEPPEPPEQRSIGSSIDCLSVTYFPEVSDVEPPPLEIGWPAFTAGSYRGVTRAVAHFQPSYGDNIYACKEAARKMIGSAREVIAIVTDSLTDLDIFKDLQEACCVRKVPVYILLDRSSCPAFLRMCANVGVGLDELQQMRVRTITGTTYYTRSGARITGRVHERFMLIDGNRAATGSYRFNWTDGKLNSSNLIELSGQITEKFDEEFRILYAQSLPVNARGPASAHASQSLERLPAEHLLTSSPYLSRERPPGHKLRPLSFSPPLPCEEMAPEDPAAPNGSAASNSSTVGDDWSEEEILAAGPAPPAERPDAGEATRTGFSPADGDALTDLRHPDLRPSVGMSAPPEECPSGLSKERRHHYAAIRSKLEHVMASLSRRRELADIAVVTRGRRGLGQAAPGPQPRLLAGTSAVVA
ncbi:protein FAM83D [Hippocampus zosterae]|uniref:protein FAM83D n=1 Tax=Hippocampus zosterae TaxID=109293 RepID=UPI00223CE5E8|nr:protein FAM83D [Hippocampus zosterae]